jgi:hypothetical protein
MVNNRMLVGKSMIWAGPVYQLWSTRCQRRFTGRCSRPTVREIAILIYILFDMLLAIRNEGGERGVKELGAKFRIAEIRGYVYMRKTWG